jgi:hypothetical protein
MHQSFRGTPFLEQFLVQPLLCQFVVLGFPQLDRLLVGVVQGRIHQGMFQVLELDLGESAFHDSGPEKFDMLLGQGERFH